MLYGADRDRSGWLIVSAEERAIRTIQDDEFSSLTWLEDGDTFVVDAEHMQPRVSEGSLAQRFTQSQLEGIHAIAQERGIDIFAIPGKQTAKFRKANSLDKGGLDSLYILRHFEETGRKYARAWMPHTKESAARHREYREIRSDMSIRLNVMRFTEPPYRTPEALGAFQRFAEIKDRLAPETVEMFRMRQTGRGPEGFTGDLRATGLMALYVAAVNRDGSVRNCSMHELWDKLLAMSPRGFGGVARSNLLHHTFGVMKDGTTLREFRHACKDVLRALRNSALRQSAE